MSKFKSPKKWPGPVRSNTGTTIRGKTISNPIPIVDDDEFPIRTPGSGIAQPLGHEDLEHIFRHRKSASHHLEVLHPHQTGIAISDFSEPPTASQAPAVTSSFPEARRTDRPVAIRNSVASVPSGSSTGTGKPERKKSGIRSAFRRIFGRRKDSTSSKSEDQVSTDTKAGLHRSDPTALRSPNGTFPLQQQRSASLPINEFNRALRSHSIVAEDLPPRNSGSTKRDSVPIAADITGRPRRATTPSRLWTPNKSMGYVDWTGLSPRPASSHPRGSRIVSAAEADTDIGTAITSTSRYNPNRRSRSLGELRDTSDGPLVIRRRSDEIKYWRESYDRGIISPLSSNKPEAEEPMVLEDEDKENEAPQEEPQPFNFGPLSELAGMKITQAASLETRVQQLEDRIKSLERAVNSHVRPPGISGERIYLQDPPARKAANTRSSSLFRTATNESEMALPQHPRHREPQQDASQDIQNRLPSFSSSHHSRPSTMSTNNSQPPSIDVFAATATPHSEPEKTPRPLSTSTTIRNPISSSPTIPKDGVFTVEHYRTLTNMILAEQAARRELEVQVGKLQQQLQALRLPAPTSYPTPDSDQNRISNFLHQPTTVGGGYSHFDRDEDSSEDEGRIGHQEVFCTPNEETGRFGDDIFGEAISHDRSEEMKTTPRTLSLSQITMGKNAKHGSDF